MALLVLARIVHIVGAIFWVGSILCQHILLYPSFKKLEPSLKYKVQLALRRQGFGPAMGMSSMLVVLSGFYLLHWNPGLSNILTLFSSGWGRSILFALFCATCSFVVGIGKLEPLLTRLEVTWEKEDMALSEELEKQVLSVSKLNMLFVVGGAVAMSIARFV